ncbi:exported hypothetical protein [Agrobacterium salinitolerans str. Hayward 0363]|nr:exported hypothetical protein [Agrobacterium salinitolerans str. Hayward 0363]
MTPWKKSWRKMSATALEKKRKSLERHMISMCSLVSISIIIVLCSQGSDVGGSKVIGFL